MSLLDKQTAVYSYSRVLFSAKRNDYQVRKTWKILDSHISEKGHNLKRNYMPSGKGSTVNSKDQRLPRVWEKR